MEPYVYVYFFLNGIANATCYFLLAAGLSLIFGVLGVFNLAHGAFFMIGAYACFQLIRWTDNFWLSILLAPMAVAVVGAITELYLIRRTYRINVNFQLLLTFGLILIIEDAIKMVWGWIGIGLRNQKYSGELFPLWAGHTPSTTSFMPV